MSETATAPAPAPADPPAAPAPAPAAPAPAPAAAAPAAAAPAPAAAPATALAAGATGAPAAAPAAPPVDPLSWLPEKYRVLGGGDGKTLDLEASAKKVAEAHGHLEKRLGSGDAPPQSADGYKVTVPEALKERINGEELAKSDDFKGFLGKMHEAGLSQKQVDAVTAELLERSVRLQEAKPMLDAAECTSTLRQQDGWKTDGEYKQQMGMAFTATKTIFGKDFEEVLEAYGNDPRFIRGMASIGREMQEDTGPSPEAMVQLNTSLDTAMADPAYTNPNHPNHAAQVARVTALQAQVAGTKPVGSGKTMTFKSG